MNILLISEDITFPGQTGSPRPYQFIRQIARRHTLRLVLPYTTELAREKLDWLQTAGPLFQDIVTFDMRSVHASHVRRAVNLLQYNAWFETRTKLPNKWLEVVKTIKSLARGVDAIWVDGLSPMQYVVDTPCPIVIDPTDCVSRNQLLKIQHTSSIYSKIVSRLLLGPIMTFERYALQQGTSVVVASAVDAAFMRQRKIAVPVVITNGCDSSYFSPDTTLPRLNGQPAVIFVGNFNYHPNYDAACYIINDIFPEVKKKLPTVKFYLVGNLPNRSFPALSDGICTTGYVPDVRKYYGGTDLFVSPLRYGTGVKNKILEAASMACSIIASAETIEGLALANGKHFVMAATKYEFSKQIETLVHNRVARRQLGQQARDLIVQDYNWETQAELFATLLEKSC